MTHTPGPWTRGMPKLPPKDKRPPDFDVKQWFSQFEFSRTGLDGLYHRIAKGVQE